MPVYQGVNCSAEEAEWFAKFDRELGPLIARVMEGNEEEAIKANWHRWEIVLKWLKGPVQRRILFDPEKAGTAEYGEKHPFYKQFEFLNRGMMEITPGEKPPLMNPLFIGPYLYILFARGEAIVEEARRFLQAEIIKADGSELKVEAPGAARAAKSSPSGTPPGSVPYASSRNRER